MGFVDVIGILEANGSNVIYWHTLKTKAPDVAYVLDLLPPLDNALPIIKLDKDWVLAWKRVDGLVLVTIGTTDSEFVEVISEDEEDEEEEEDTDQSSDSEIDDGGQQAYHHEYEQLEDNALDTELKEQKEADGDESSLSERIPLSISSSQNPAQYFTFMSIFIEALKAFFNTDTLTRYKVHVNAHKITMILQELVDSGVPFIVDINQLREHIPSKSILNSILNTTKQIQNSATTSLATFKQGGIGAIGSNLSSMSFGNGAAGPSRPQTPNYSIVLEKSGSPTPWRKAIVKHTQNELFVDLYETITLKVITSSSKRSSKYSYANNYTNSFRSSSEFSKATINGNLNMRSSISGQALVSVTLESPLYNAFTAIGREASDVFDSSCMLSRCINKKVWMDSALSNNRNIQCVPPDGKSTLLTYTIDIAELNGLSNKLHGSGGYFNMQKFTGLVDVELQTGLGNPISEANLKNEFEIVVSTGTADSVKELESLIIDIELPNFSSTEQYEIRVLRSSSGSLMKNSKGTWQWIFESPIILGATFSLRCAINNPSLSNANELNINLEQTKHDSQLGNGGPSYGAGSHLTRTVQSNEKGNDHSAKILKPLCLNVKYNYKGGVFTGTKIKSIEILDDGEMSKIKPFKGVKYNARSLEFIVK